MVDLQMHHTLPLLLCLALHLHGAFQERERWVNLEEFQHHVKDPPTNPPFPWQKQVLIVQSLQRTTGETVQSLEPTSQAPLLREDMLQTYNNVTLDQAPGVEGDNAELQNFKAAMLFFLCCSSRLLVVLCHWAGTQPCQFAVSHLIFFWLTV